MQKAERKYMVFVIPFVSGSEEESLDIWQMSFTPLNGNRRLINIKKIAFKMLKLHANF